MTDTLTKTLTAEASKLLRRHEVHSVPRGTERKFKRIGELRYRHREGVDRYIVQIKISSPDKLIALERDGVSAVFVQDLGKHIGMSTSVFYGTLGIPKSTASKAIGAKGKITGVPAQASVTIAKLLGVVQDILSRSTAPAAKEFDAAKWLGNWLVRPHPALNGQCPSEIVATNTGAEIAMRLLRSMESGSFQ